ncbi:MAG: anthranilate synthase component I [Bacteroidetes bacterium]|nr:anthranilate synthase component I [Bacteroidota bacterium]
MTFDEFKSLSENYNVIPVYEKITADLLTPVSAYLKIRKPGNRSFLLESVEGIGRLARYSFIGKEPSKIISNNGIKLTIKNESETSTFEYNIFDYLQSEIKYYKHPVIDELPDFTGGIVGFLGYENICLIEDVLEFENNNSFDTPDSIFGIYNTIIAFDHFKHQIVLISNVHINQTSDLKASYQKAKQNIKIIKDKLSKPLEYKSDFSSVNENGNEINTEEFGKAIDKIKNNIYEGDVFQLVISKRFSAKFNGDLLNVYRALRIINPSPYMYYMELENDFTIIGTSPEDLLKVKQNKATILPIAGTRRRGKTAAEDKILEEDLLNDPKEIAEHMMLVDLARNDLGRVCEYNTVKLSEEKQIHKFSHVMHIVSRVEGKLVDDKDCIDALKASYPAGTVTGAPKIKAMELINNYENQRRNVYAGAIGYIDFSGNLDMCIAIRTFFSKGNKIYWQAGAGIVADSKAELEIKEIYNKSAVLNSALKYAEVIDENFGD